MTAPSEDLVIRPARPEDREPVLAFCQRTWDWGDYIEHVWDEWLASPDGLMIVGDLGGRPVAVARAVLASPGEGWLEGLRVDPDVRRAGVGRTMSKASLDAARQLGARVVRFATYGTNYAVHRIAAELGYHRVAVYALWEAPALAEPGPLPVPVGPDQLPGLAASISVSPTDLATGGLEWRAWRCRKLTLEELSRRVAAGEALIVRDADGTGPESSLQAGPAPEVPAEASTPGPSRNPGGRTVLRGESIAALALVASRESDDSELVAEYLDDLGNPPEHLTALALALRRLAADRGLAGVEARVPDVPAVRTALSRAGFSPGSDPESQLWIFEIKS